MCPALVGAQGASSTCRQAVLRFSLQGAYSTGHGFCVKCQSVHKVSKKFPTLMSGGYPCQPFSEFRRHDGSTARTSRSPESHPLYPVLMEGFPDYLRARKPQLFILENVEALSSTNKNQIAFVHTDVPSLSAFSIEEFLMDGFTEEGNLACV